MYFITLLCRNSMDLRGRKFLIKMLVLPLSSWMIWVTYFWVYYLMWKTGIITVMGSENWWYVIWLLQKQLRMRYSINRSYDDDFQHLGEVQHYPHLKEHELWLLAHWIWSQLDESYFRSSLEIQNCMPLIDNVRSDDVGRGPYTHLIALHRTLHPPVSLTSL